MTSQTSRFASVLLRVVGTFVSVRVFFGDVRDATVDDVGHGFLDAGNDYERLA